MMPSRLLLISLFLFFFRNAVLLHQHAAALLLFAVFVGDLLADFFNLVCVRLSDETPARQGVDGANPLCQRRDSDWRENDEDDGPQLDEFWTDDRTPRSTQGVWRWLGKFADVVHGEGVGASGKRHLRVAEGFVQAQTIGDHQGIVLWWLAMPDRRRIFCCPRNR